MPQVQHTDKGEALLKELQKRLNVTGDYILPKTIFGDLINFWRTQANTLRPVDFTKHPPVEFNTEWLIFSDQTKSNLMGLVDEIRWEFVAGNGLDNFVARLFQFTLHLKLKELAWDHLRKYITTRHFRDKPRIGLSLPAAAFQSLSGPLPPKAGPYRKDVAKALTAMVEEIVEQALARAPLAGVDALVAAMDQAEAAIGPVQPAEDDVFCIFDVSLPTKTALVEAAEKSESKFSDRVAALILQKLHVDELPGMQGAQ